MQPIIHKACFLRLKQENTHPTPKLLNLFDDQTLLTSKQNYNT